MTHTNAAMDWIVTKQLVKITQLAHRATNFDPTAIKDGYPGRVITTILQASEPLEKNGSCFTMTNITNNTAHKWNLVRELSVVSYSLSVKKDIHNCSRLSLATDY
jgi:hypothetical protein